MTGLLKQSVLLMFFAALVAAVVVLNHYSANHQSLERYGFYLTESSQASGIDFVHELPTKIDGRLERIMPIIASMGAGVSIVDFNKDGLLDIYVVNSREGSKNRLYKNMGNGTFKDVAEEMGVADLNQPGTGVCMGAVWGDFDNDGYEDLLVYKWGKPELFHNDKGKGFTCVSDKAGLPKWVNANAAVWLDFNRDGHLDLFIAGYWADDVNLWDLKTTKIMPESFKFANNGGKKYLLRNKGDGTFQDVTSEMGIESTRWTLSAGAANLCGSGWPDLLLANDYGKAELYRNDQGKRFVLMKPEECGIGVEPESGMNVSFGDIHNQGRLAAYITNISEPGQLVQYNKLWVPQQGTAGAGVKFMNQAATLRVGLGGWSWGAQFGDFNNDGLLDIILTNGYISADRKQTYWFDYSQLASGNEKIAIIDAETWPAMKGLSLSGYQQKCLWVNRKGQFIDVAQASGFTELYDGRAIALADFGNRGILDAVIAHQKGPLLLYKNTVTEDNHWVQFELEGIKSNRSAIGAQVRLFWNRRQQVQEVSGGSGYAAQNMRRLHFGLGKDPQIEKVVIDWPSGLTQTITAPRPGIVHRIKEASE
jgi:enediyne biosynthesis protein E4